MTYPPLVSYASEAEYQKHFEDVYCKEPIATFDGIPVRFRKRDFHHAFFESVRGGHDNLFSTKRAERIDWIKKTLQDPNADRYQGWDKKNKKYDKSRRVTVVMGNYIVVIVVRQNKRTGDQTGHFITAYVADTPAKRGRPSTIDRIRRSPKL